MIFEDLAEQGYVYHIVNIYDLKKSLAYGINFDDKKTYVNKYLNFHSYLDQYRTIGIPSWVERRKAIFASFGFRENHGWHSHTAILKVKIERERCWICNENEANFLYEPFVLKQVEAFRGAERFLELHGPDIIRNYWMTSLSYSDNLKERRDKKEGYDAEVLILHPIPPENIQCMFILSDHQWLQYQEWEQFFARCCEQGPGQYSRYLHPKRTYSAWKMSGSQ